MPHTPGPWGISKIGNPYSQFIVYTWDGNSIAHSVEGEDNAHLIAAAPELLEALELLKGEYDNAMAANRMFDWGALEYAHKVAATAIAKAKGE